MTDLMDNYFLGVSAELIQYWLRYNCENLKDYAIAQVFSSYILGNRKGTYVVLVNGKPYNNLYFEVTQSEDRFCLDVYSKIDRVWREDREL